MFPYLMSDKTFEKGENDHMPFYFFEHQARTHNGKRWDAHWGNAAQVQLVPKAVRNICLAFSIAGIAEETLGDLASDAETVAGEAAANLARHRLPVNNTALPQTGSLRSPKENDLA